MIFLSPTELQQLTGYETARYQKRWLIINRWLFGLDARKRPVVLRRYAEQRLGVVNDIAKKEVIDANPAE